MRTYDESCLLLDRIVGRCIRDGAFAEHVLEDPATALKEYDLNEDELEDFTELRKDHRQEAGEGWKAIRNHVGGVFEDARGLGKSTNA